MKLQKQIAVYTCLLGFGITLLPIGVFAAKNIPVPYTAQSPDGKWIQPWKDLCEEASILMVDQYYQGKNLDKKRAKQLLLHIFEVKNRTYGRSLDESAEKIASLINNFLPWEAYVIDAVTLEQVKEQIDLNKPVIVPVSGKDLKNPNFRQGGPRYHVLVISGYDDEKQEFITQEPGTHLGLDFRYAYDTIMGANHDLLPTGDIRQGARRMVFTTEKIDSSAGLDPDNDDLTKAQELSLGTSLTEKDTDKDGFSDGIEVQHGYSPFINEGKLPNNSLIKTASDPTVYLFQNKIKRAVQSESAFNKKGWKWADIKIVSDRFITSVKTGTPIE